VIAVDGWEKEGQVLKSIKNVTFNFPARMGISTR